METKYYFTYTDLWPDEYTPIYPNTEALQLVAVNKLVNKALLGTTVTYSQTLFKKEEQTLNKVCNLVYNRWTSKEVYLLITDHEEPTDADKKKVGYRIGNALQLTLYKYGEKVKKYETLLKNTIPTKLTSNSESRFNDTPTEEGNYNTERFTTNITQTSSSTDIDPVTRYSQISAIIEDIYTEWAHDIENMVEIYA